MALFPPSAAMECARWGRIIYRSITRSRFAFSLGRSSGDPGWRLFSVVSRIALFASGVKSFARETYHDRNEMRGPAARAWPS
jgi:hypothetical protein